MHELSKVLAMPNAPFAILIFPGLTPTQKTVVCEKLRIPSKHSRIQCSNQNSDEQQSLKLGVRNEQLN